LESKEILDNLVKHCYWIEEVKKETNSFSQAITSGIQFRG